MKHSLPILIGTYVVAVLCLLGFLRLVDLTAQASTAAPVSSAIEVMNLLLSLLCFVGAIASCTAIIGCFVGFITVALDKNEN